MIKLLANVVIALRALRVNKMRSALTMLGIVIGVAAVIAMIAVGTGASLSIQRQIVSFGSNMIMVFPGSVSSGGVRMGWGAANTLTMEDAEAIARECPSVVAASPAVGGSAQVVYGNNNWSTRIQGITPDYLVVRNYEIHEGASLTAGDVSGATKHVLIGQTVVDNLFGSVDPIGQTIRINRVPFTVMGTLVEKGSALGQNLDDVIFMPISTAKKRVLGDANQVNSRSVREIMVAARTAAQMPQAVNEIRNLLRQRHNLQIYEEDDFQVRNSQEFFGALQNATLIASLLISSIAAISLLVGGIGIMNTMLISVTERTREIGLRQAVGAKTSDIRMQFLIESVVLSLIGGAIGIGVGLGLVNVISRFAPWEAIVPPSSIVLAFGFSAFVGIFFGFYPAHKAAKLDPIEALRYE